MIVTRVLPLLLAWSLLVVAGRAQAQSLTLSEPWFQSGTAVHSWRYEVRLANVEQETVVFLDLRIPDCLQVHQITNPDVTSTTRRRSPFTEVTLTAQRDATVTLVVTGAASDVQHGPVVEHQWRDGNNRAQPLRRPAPERRYDPSLVRAVLGIGGSLLRDDFVDFGVSDDGNTLLVVNDSRTRATTTVGALFNVPGPFDVLASFSFTSPSTRALDGVLFGATFDLNTYLSVGGGFALHLGKKLSPGFRRHAEAAVRAAPDEYDVFAEIVNREKAEKERLTLYDGFPLDGGGGRVFPGAPLTDSTNSSWFVGFFVPVDFRDWFRSRSGA